MNRASAPQSHPISWSDSLNPELAPDQEKLLRHGLMVGARDRDCGGAHPDRLVVGGRSAPTAVDRPAVERVGVGRSAMVAWRIGSIPTPTARCAETAPGSNRAAGAGLLAFAAGVGAPRARAICSARSRGASMPASLERRVLRVSSRGVVVCAGMRRPARGRSRRESRIGQPVVVFVEAGRPKLARDGRCRSGPLGANRCAGFGP